MAEESRLKSSLRKAPLEVCAPTHSALNVHAISWGSRTQAGKAYEHLSRRSSSPRGFAFQRQVDGVHGGSALSTRATMSICVVDDHPTMRDAIAMVMRRLHPHRKVVELKSLAELMLFLDATGRPELILLDLRLPDTAGCSGVRLVKRHHPDVPLAVCSASPAADTAEECIQAGADAYIEKTTGTRHLVDALRGLLLDVPFQTNQLLAIKGNNMAPRSW